MNELLGKISTYNLFNYLFSGVLFVVLTNVLTSFSFIQENIVIGLFLYYFIGLVISRIGSIIIEPILKGLSFVRFKEYQDYIAASKQDAFIETLSEVNNMYRTLVSVFVTLILLRLYEIIKMRFLGIATYETYVLLTFLLIMFLFAYKKQTAYITKRIEKVNTN